MARVRNIQSSELPPDLASIYERFAGAYGPFRNQAAVFAHVPAALRHVMGMLLELREAATLPKRVLELAIVTVSKLNECDYCVAHHTPFLIVEGVTPAGVERILDYPDHPEFDDRDKLVIEYAIAAWERPNRIPDALFARLNRLRKNAGTSSFRGAGSAREPGIQEHGPEKSMAWPVFMDSGPGPDGRPGMTREFFSSLLKRISARPSWSS